jgi:hypothetical protein
VTASWLWSRRLQPVDDAEFREVHRQLWAALETYPAEVEVTPVDIEKEEKAAEERQLSNDGGRGKKKTLAQKNAKVFDSGKSAARDSHDLLFVCEGVSGDLATAVWSNAPTDLDLEWVQIELLKRMQTDWQSAGWDDRRGPDGD